MAKDLLIDLLKDLGSDYDYTSGAFTVTSTSLGEFDTAALVLRVDEVVGTDSTFKIETSIDNVVFVTVDHSLLTDGVLTIGSATENHNFLFSDFIERYIRVTFTPNTSTGIVKSIKILGKQ